MSTPSEGTKSNPRWSEADPDEDMFGDEPTDAYMRSPDFKRQSAEYRRVYAASIARSASESAAPSTPTPKGKGKKKRAAAQAQLSPHTPRAGPSSAASSLSYASPAPAGPIPQPVFSPANPLAPSTPGVEAIPPPDHKHSGQILEVLSRSVDILTDWSGKTWATPRDQMRIARHIASLVRVAFTNGWQAQPFSNAPGTPSLLSVIRECIPLLQSP